jgi:flavin-binding protein dodecin
MLLFGGGLTNTIHPHNVPKPISLKSLSYFSSINKTKLTMIVKVIEVIASSEKGIEDAIQKAVTEVSKTVRNIDSVFVKDIKAHVQDGKISTYGVICKISFRVND